MPGRLDSVYEDILCRVVKIGFDGTGWNMLLSRKNNVPHSAIHLLPEEVLNKKYE